MKWWPMSARDTRLWAAIVIGPTAWFLDHAIAYAITPPAHLWESKTPTLVLHGSMLVACVIAGLLGARELRPVMTGDATVMQRARFMAVAAIALAVISLLLIVGNAITSLMLVPGAEP